MKTTNVLLALTTTTWLLNPAIGEITFTKRGEPNWKPVDAFISAVDFPRNTNLDEFDVDAIEFLSGGLGDSYVAAEDELYVLFPTDGQVNAQGRDFREAVAQAGGFESDVFVAADMLNHNRIFRGLTIVESNLSRFHLGEGGPVDIPESVFPITSTWKYEYLSGDNIIADCNLCEPVIIEALGEYGTVVDENGDQRDFSDEQWSHIPTWWTMAFVGNWSASEIAGDHEGIIEYRDVNGNGWDVSFKHSVEPRRTRVDGDLNYDNVLDVNDVNVVSQNVALGSTNARLDLNDDDKVDHSDFHYLITGLMNTWIGDSNLDGEFNSGDFVDVFTAGKYETGDFANWSEGDWNADERFDSSDFVAAFANGGYEMGTRPTPAAVPEPSGMWLPLLGMLVIVRRFRSNQ